MAAKAFPLIFKGINLKREPGLLQDGEFSDAQNVTSQLEGGLSPRAGQLGLPDINIGGTFIHSAHKMALGGPDANDPRYLGLSNSPSTILRVTGPYTAGVNVTPGLFLSNARWDAECFNAGNSGTPTIFFAHPTRMMRDDSTFAPLRQWGIVPALRPVRLALSAPDLVVLDDNSGSATLRINTTVTSASLVMGSWWRIVPASMQGITAGTLVILNGVDTIIDQADVTSFYAYYAGTPAGTIISGMKYTPSGGVADGTSFDVNVTGLGPADWSFGGSINDGFNTNDLIAGMVSVAAVSTAGPLVQVITLRIYVNGSTVDYYEAPLDAFADGSYGDFEITKSDFTAVGQAGSGAYSWQKVTGYGFHVTTNTIPGTPPVPILTGNIYGSAGQGPNSASFPAAQPYSYIYTLRNPATGEQGNPSQPIIASSAINSAARAVLVECAGVSTQALDGTEPVGDPSLTGFGSIAVYRSGGIFADGFYRFVGYSSNPGLDGSGVPLPVIFTDNQSDDDIVNNDTVEYDNYPPVPSNLKTPIAATLVAGVGTGWTNIQLTGYSGPADLTTVLKIGSTFTIGSNANQETCVIAAVFADNIDAYLQYAHAAGEQFSCDFVVGQPCDLLCTAGDSLLVAGDVNNPHVVYRSKAGFPQAFPVRNLETGNAHTQIIGSPDNPINGLVDYGGWYVSLNKEKIFTFQIWLGQFLNVTATPSERGMIGKRCWIRVQGSIWFLSYDGIYAWSGSGSQKVTEDIDQIFRGLAVGRFQPLDYTALDKVHFEFFENKVLFTYQDTNGNLQNIRYDMIYKRWEPLSYASPISCMLTEQDTGRLLAGSLSGQAMLLEQGTIDIDGPIVWWGRTAPYAPEGRTVQKQFTELMIELQNEVDTVRAALFYDYSPTVDPVDQFIIAPAPGRRFVPLPLQVAGGSTNGKEARVCAILFFGASSGTVTIFSTQLSYNPLAEIQRGRITDWTDLGYPFDKKLYEMWIDYDMKGQTVVMNLDTITGLNGNVINLGVQQFTLTGAGRAQVNIAIEDHTVVKKVRLRPNVPNLDFEIFNWDFPGYEKYPPDVSLFTPQSDNGWACEKVYRGYTVEINTDDVPCTLTTEVDGVDVHSTSVSATDNDRMRIITLPTDLTDEIIGKMARLKLAPGTDGRAQLFKGPLFDYWKEPCYRTFWDSGELVLGTQSFKVIKQIWFEYLCPGPITMRLYVSNGVLFWTTLLPAHGRRDVERVFPPDAAFPPDVLRTVYNKSKLYRVVLSSAATPADNYAIAFSSSLGQLQSDPGGDSFVIGLNRGGIPVEVKLYAVGPPVTTPLQVNLNINGVPLLSSPISLNPGQSGPVTSTAFIGFPALAYNGVVTPVVVQGSLSSAVVLELIVQKTPASPPVPFKFYNQGCRLESLDLSGDQRAGYRQFPLSEATSTQA